MRVISVLLTAIALLCEFASSDDVGIREYGGYQVLRASPTNALQHEALVDLYNKETFEFWVGPSKTIPADIMVDHIRRHELEMFLRQNEIPFTVFIKDVGSIIKEQKATRATRDMNWDDYQLLTTIYDWLDGLVSSYPNVLSITTIGQSTEGRDLKVLKISTGGENKIGFWIDATIHGNEWIGTSTVTYIINELVTKSNDYANLLDVLDFYILPVINPDGYEYAHTTDRMWRKTRSNHNSTLGCIGVDANRNFGFHWGETGSSSNKCFPTYRGPNEYSEPEALAMKDHIEFLRQTVNMHAYISLHSYSQLWMTPYGYSDDLTDDYNELKRLGEEAVAELGSHYGTAYQVGNAASILYFSSGSSRDWAKGEGGFTYVYTIELRDTGEYGFLLPKEQIIPTAVETWAGIQVIARNYLKK